MQRVFISHASADHVPAARLCAGLEARGMACWIAPRDLRAGAEWAEQIIDGIRQADVMLLLVSARSNRSVHVRREVERAVDRGVALLPVRIENVRLAKGLEYFLSAQQWLDACSTPIDPHVAPIARAIERIRQNRDEPRASRAPVARLAATELDGIRNVFAHYIGPIAATLVELAAATAPDRASLRAALAAEVDDPHIREAFLADCRRLRL